VTRFLAIVWLTLCCVTAQAKEVIPPAPQNHFNDYANVVSSATTSQLNNELVQFERDTGNQFVVAIYPKMQSDSSIEEYTVRVARAWGVGTKEKNNGIVLFIFTQDHKMFIQTGYGLEGALPDVLCKRIVEDEIAPRFRANDFNGGVTAGVHAIIAATKGEYKGAGRTVAEARRGAGNRGNENPFLSSGSIWFIFFVIIVVMMLLRRLVSPLGWLIGSSGYSSGWGGGWSGGGGGFSGGGGSFSGGGGSFGGGGAGGSW
jgi:uncharacterized protein